MDQLLGTEDGPDEGHHPCNQKIECEASATEQLLALSSADNSKETGNASYLATCKKFRQKNPSRKVQVDILQPDETNAKLMTVSDIYESLSVKEDPCNIATDFCCWQLCPTIHAETVKYGIVDASRLKPRPKKYDHNITSTMGKLSVRVANSPSKLKLCRSSRLDNKRPKSVASRPSSTSAKREDLGVWQEPPPPIPIQYSFKYLKHPRQYSDQYREMYTYSKLKDSNLNRASFISGVIAPRAKKRCNNSGKMKVITSSESGKVAAVATPICSDHDQDKARTLNWHFNQQLLETCDVELSVNNPSPTEIAFLSKIPQIHRSSPSIPSNTNGKYGGRGTDKPYPFQLNISADARTVIAPSNKLAGPSICIH